MTGVALFVIALEAEWTKFRRALLPRMTTVLLVAGITALCATFMFASMQPGSVMAAKLASMIQGDGWAGYLGLAAQVVATAGLIGPGVVLAWLFGREFADATISGLFAIPVGRRTVAVAKLVLFALWSLAFTLGLLGMLVLAGMLVGLGVPGPEVAPWVLKLGTIALLSAGLSVPAALAATLARGYLGAMGALMGLVVVTQIAVASGAGGWFAFAAPGLWATSPGTGLDPTTALQLALVVPVGGAIAAFTVFVWRRLQLH